MTENLNFCQKPSKEYLKKLEECGGDPRSVEGFRALNKAGTNVGRGWQPTWEARDARK